jgi:imidazole glycerol-phosphate synthase subunit HisH
MPNDKPVKLAVIDYGMGNLRSVSKAFEHCGADTHVISTSGKIEQYDALVLPGVGALGDCISGLKQCGMADTIKSWIGENRPFFGICLGLQALFDFSEEGNVKGLGIIPGKVKRFDLSKAYKIPHMGWNAVNFTEQTPITEGMPLTGEQFYFVHSYYVSPENPSAAWCKTNYEKDFVSGIKQGNCFATQFHPEKSQSRGLQLYSNFVKWVSSQQ